MRAALLTVLKKYEEDDKTKFPVIDIYDTIAENLSIKTGRDSDKYKKMMHDAKILLSPAYGDFKGTEFRLTCDKKSCIDTLEKEMKAHEE